MTTTVAFRAGSAIVRIDLLRFLAGCRKRRLNQALSVSIIFFSVFLFIMATFCVLLACVGMCPVFWLFWLSCQYFPKDSSEEAQSWRVDRLHKVLAEECLRFSWFIYSSQLSGLEAPLRRYFPYKFRPGLGLNPGPRRGIQCSNHCTKAATPRNSIFPSIPTKNCMLIV